MIPSSPSDRCLNAHKSDIAAAGLVFGATMRLARLVVADDLGQWLIKDKARAAVVRYYNAHGHTPWWNKYLAGLDCPYCVGQWIAFGVLGSYVATRNTRMAGAWRFVAAGLTLNLSAAHLGARLGDVSDVSTPYEESPT